MYNNNNKGNYSVPHSLRLGFAEPPPSEREAFGKNRNFMAPSLRELAGHKARLRELTQT